jgi:deoxycytidylate deaminase
MSKYELNWSDIAFGDKEPLKNLRAIFIAPSREITVKRFTQIIKLYLPVANIVIGCTKEKYIDGFGEQPQFKTLQISDIKSVVDKVNQSDSPHKITILNCKQSDCQHIYKKIKFRSVLLVNGSWRYTFHTRPEYYALTSRNITFEFISPFVSEEEALKYVESMERQMPILPIGELLGEREMMAASSSAANYSFDNTFQTGVSLGIKSGDKYKLLMASYNKTVPYLTFAWHTGSLRERHLSPPGDLNHYDTVHAEVMLLIQAQKKGLKLSGTTLFINLLPCPTCARMLCETDINEIVYSIDHSDGYAVTLLEKAGKTVRRLVMPNDKVSLEE